MKSYQYPLPSYWEKFLTNKIRKIQRLQEEAGESCACVAMLTDFHWRENAKNSVALLERILKECDIPYFFNAGDVVSGAGTCTAEFLREEIRGCKRLFLPLEEKCLYAEGNHDRAYCTFEPPAYYVENLPKTEFDKLYFSSLNKYPNRQFGAGGYYYADDVTNKVRYIVLNGQDVPNDEIDERGYAKYNAMLCFGFLQKQIEWFANVALVMPSPNWSVIVCSHASPNGVKVEERSYNYSLMTGVLKAFQGGTTFKSETVQENPLFNARISVDFTGKGGNVIAWLGGHTHKDAIAVENGIVCVDTTTDSAFVSLYPEKAGTTAEQAFDVFVINRNKRKGKIIRIGVGEDREFVY